ncbi:hypothetical protein CRYUN_Cryun04dG0140800 [Craigia yunnanensis]
MGFSGVPAIATATDGGPEPDSESALLLHSPLKSAKPEDKFNLAYIIYFTLGVGFLLPWNAFITAVDYFSYLYPEASVDRVFAVVYMLGRVGLYDGFYITVGVVGLAGIADALVQGGLIGAAGELPKRYMQAIVAGTAGSGVFVSVLRILTKAVFPQDADGLRKSANLYFSTSIVVMVICIVLYNVAHRLPIMKYYEELKIEAVKVKKEEKVLLITGYNVFDLVGKSLTAVYLLENAKVAVAACVVRLLFFPLFIGCLHGPQFFRTEIPVSILTCLLGLTNGYFTSVLMIMAPKSVQIQHAETAGIVIVLFLVVGLASGSVIAWDINKIIRRVNTTSYGLAAGVFTQDIDAANTLTHALKVGRVWVNCYDVFDAAIPFGGYKMSEQERENASILKFKDIDEVIRRANTTSYGLAAGIFTQDRDTANTLTHALKVGRLWVNHYDVSNAAIPFGGYKMSEQERENGIHCLNNYFYGLAVGVFTQDIDTANTLTHVLKVGRVWVNCYDVSDATIPFGRYKMSEQEREKGIHCLNNYLQVKAVVIPLKNPAWI